MFLASETAKSTRNECQAVLGVHFDYDLVVGCVRTCFEKDKKADIVWHANIGSQAPLLIQIFPSDFCFAILHFRLKSHGVYAIINTTPHKMGDAVWIDLIFSRMLRG